MKSNGFIGVICIIALLAATISAAAPPLGPEDVIGSKDGKSLFVALLDAKQVAQIDLASGKITRTLDMPAEPTGLAVSPDGATLYVSCQAPKSPICEVDIATWKITTTMTAGHYSLGPCVSPDGKTLYVCNRFDDDVSVIDLTTKKETRRIKVPREPTDSVITPDGKTLIVCNHLTIDASDSYDVATLMSLIDTETFEVDNVRLPNGAADMRGVCVSPDGKYCYGTHILARYQMPTTQLERGWMNTNSVSIVDIAARKHVNSVLLDDVDLGAANPWSVVCSPDGKYLCVGHAGTHEVSIIDFAKMHEKLASLPEKPEPGATGYAYSTMTVADVPNNLAFLVGMRRRIRLEGNGPHGMVIIGDKLYVAEYYSDTIAVVELEPKPSKPVTTITLNADLEMSVQRKGRMFFNDASLCFQQWQSCASCHPDARTDALNWDLMNDGLGNPKNVKSMLLAHATPPAMITGIRASAEIAVRAGITHIQFAVRPEEDAVAIDEFLKGMEPVPSPRLVDGKLSETAVRGKVIFDDIGCVRCHPSPLYTDLLMHDVGSRTQFDRTDNFDTPTLVEVWRTAPYMHDGQFVTMEDLLREGRHGQKGKGGKVDLTEEQITDLVEYVMSL